MGSDFICDLYLKVKFDSCSNNDPLTTKDIVKFILAERFCNGYDHVSGHR